MLATFIIIGVMAVIIAVAGLFGYLGAAAAEVADDDRMI